MSAAQGSPTPILSLARGGFQIRTSPSSPSSLRRILVEAGGKTFELASATYRISPAPVNFNLHTIDGGRELLVSSTAKDTMVLVPVGAQAAQPIEIPGANPIAIRLNEGDETNLSSAPPNKVISVASKSEVLSEKWTLPAFSARPILIGTRVYYEAALHHLPVRLQWSPVRNAKYGVQVFKGDKPVLGKTDLRKSSYEFGLNSLDSEQYSYQVVATLPWAKKYRLKSFGSKSVSKVRSSESGHAKSKKARRS